MTAQQMVAIHGNDLGDSIIAANERSIEDWQHMLDTIAHWRKGRETL